MIIVLIGPPGVGKGTQGALIAQEFNIKHIVAGDLLREKSQDDRDLQEMLSSGNLVPEHYINDMIASEISALNDHCILDGYPRTISQAKYLESLNIETKVLYFNCPHDVLIKRISGRFYCEKCGTIYNRYFKNTDVEKVCDICQSDSFKVRQDDHENIVARRLSQYEEKTHDLIEFYNTMKIMNLINADRDMESIKKESIDIVSSFLMS